MAMKKQERDLVRQMRENNRNEYIEFQVDELAQKMQMAKDIRENRNRQIQQRQERKQNTISENSDFFKRKLYKAEKQSMAKEQSIRHMEKVEADMLERIKNTQNLQIQAFNQLEEVMY